MNQSTSKTQVGAEVQQVDPYHYHITPGEGSFANLVLTLPDEEMARGKLGIYRHPSDELPFGVKLYIDESQRRLGPHIVQISENFGEFEPHFVIQVPDGRKWTSIVGISVTYDVPFIEVRSSDEEMTGTRFNGFVINDY